ncbi:MAG: hypothetical protein ACREDD_09450 [Methylocella sp.]
MILVGRAWCGLPVLLILGGSTFGAIVIVYLYRRSKQVWCRFLFPINGVLGLLAKLAPVHFRVEQDAWTLSRQSGNAGLRTVNCVPLFATKIVRGGAALAQLRNRAYRGRGAKTLGKLAHRLQPNGHCERRLPLERQSLVRRAEAGARPLARQS